MRWHAYLSISSVVLFWQGLVAYKACNIDSWLINGCRSQYECIQQVIWARDHTPFTSVRWRVLKISAVLSLLWLLEWMESGRKTLVLYFTITLESEFFNAIQTWVGMFLKYARCFSADTVQLTGNVTGTRTTRHASTRETREGTGSPRGIASKTKTTRELNYSQFTQRLLLRVLAQSWYSLCIKFTSQNIVTCSYNIYVPYTEHDCYAGASSRKFSHL